MMGVLRREQAGSLQAGGLCGPGYLAHDGGVIHSYRGDVPLVRVGHRMRLSSTSRQRLTRCPIRPCLLVSAPWAQPSHHAPASSSPLHCHARSASIPRHIAPRVPVVVFSPCSVAARSVCGDCQCAPVVLGLPVSDVCRAASPAPHCGALRISIIERRRQ